MHRLPLPNRAQLTQVIGSVETQTVHTARRSFPHYVPPTALAPPTLKSKHLPTSVPQTYKIRHRLQYSPLHGAGAPHRAPTSVRTFTSVANIQQTHVLSDLVVCRQHTKPTTSPPPTLATAPLLITSCYPSLLAMDSNSNLPST
jgi:hypothetical protein